MSSWILIGPPYYSSSHVAQYCGLRPQSIYTFRLLALDQNLQHEENDFGPTLLCYDLVLGLQWYRCPQAHSV